MFSRDDLICAVNTIADYHGSMRDSVARTEVLDNDAALRKENDDLKSLVMNGDTFTGELLERIAELEEVFAHTHSSGENTGRPIDRCSVCELDIRDGIHLRTPDERTQKIRFPELSLKEPANDTD